MLPYPKNIAPQGHLNVNTDFRSFKLISDEFGAKAATLPVPQGDLLRLTLIKAF